MNEMTSISRHSWIKHETKKETLLKFIFLVILILFYLAYMSLKFGVKDGFFVTLLTWSFFVFSTPIADAGFILAFPIRLLFKIKMMYTQLVSFLLALLLNLYAFFFTPEIYNKTVILKLFHQILSQPFPFWGIILLSIIGTLFSIYFGDELIDVVKHSERKEYHKHRLIYKIIVTLFIFGVTLILYTWLLQGLDISIPL
ncbi:hypothetical protein H6776_01045 [Candidatus Nomurabacteria bacterium]|nr:hypothetical protein [Candidatus Nomurabacteria bacterium]